MQFKFWVAHARYDQPDASDFAGQTFTVEIQNPKGEKVFTRNFTADEFGGFDGSFELPSDATLGVYQVFTSQTMAAARSASRSTRSPSSR